MDNTSLSDFEKLKRFIDFFNFDFIVYDLIRSNNLCAVLAEVVLQSGMNYKTVVKPRIEKILYEYNYLDTTDKIINHVNFNNVEKILDWRGTTRKERFINLVQFMYENDINCCEDLRRWLEIIDNQTQILSVNGIGPKSLDYMMLLVGISAIPIDRHLLSFAEMSGISKNQYNYVSYLYKKVSDYYDIEYHVLDSTIWNFMNQILVT